MDERRETIPVAPGAGRRRVLALGLTLGGLAGALWLGAASDGFFQDDDITHYRFARGAWDDPVSRWHRWARPGYNLPTMVVAHFFGMSGCRAFSALLTAATALLAYGIARRLNLPLAFLAPALVWAQPETMKLATTTLTETPAALYLALGVWLYLCGRRVLACAAFSPMFVTRYETMALAPVLLAALALDSRRRGGPGWGWMLKGAWAPAYLAALLWAPAGYAAAAVAYDLPPAFSPLHMLAGASDDSYGCGGWGHFLLCLMLGMGAGMTGLMIVGAGHLRRRGWLLIALAGGLVVLHTLLYRFNVFASGGYPRFLVPGASVFAVLACAGLGALWNARTRVGPSLVFVVLAVAVRAVAQYAPTVLGGTPASAGALVLLSAAVLMLWGGSTRAPTWMSRLALAGAVGAISLQDAVLVRPLSMASNPQQAVVAQAVGIIRRSALAGRTGMTTHVLVPYLYDLDGASAGRIRTVKNIDDANARWARAAAGTLFFWDGKYGRTAEEKRRNVRGRLYGALAAHRGARVCEIWIDGAGAAVFEKLPGPISTAGPRTRPSAHASALPGGRRD